MAGEFDFSNLMNGLGDAGAGAASGFMAGGPSGAAIGAGLNLATSLLQGLQANKQKKQANAAMPELQDPNQAAFLTELNQKRRSLETGADYAGAMGAINSTTAGTQEAISRNTGGDVGGTIQALLQAQSSGNTAKNNVLSNAANEQLQYNSMYGGLLNQIAARRLQLQMYNSQQNRAEWAKMQQNANQNAMAGITGAAGLLLGKQQKQNGGVPDWANNSAPADTLSSLNPGMIPTDDPANANLYGEL